MSILKTSQRDMHVNMQSRLREHMQFKNSSGSKHAHAGKYYTQSYDSERNDRKTGKLTPGHCEFGDKCPKPYTTNGGWTYYNRQRTFSRPRKRMDGQNVFGSKVHADFSVNRPVSQASRDGNSGTANGRQLTSDGQTQEVPYNATGNINLKNQPIKPECSSTSAFNPRPFFQTPADKIKQDNQSTKGDTFAWNVNTGFKPAESPVDSLSGRSLQKVDGNKDVEVQGAVKKLSQENKNSRQLLMLQQQMYQEDQPPVPHDPAGPKSTQFFSHVTKFQETTSYYGYSDQWQAANYGNQAPGDGYQGYNNNNKYQYKSFHNGYPQQNGYNGSYNSSAYPYQQPYMGTQNASYPYGNVKYDSFCPIKSQSPSPCNSSASSSPCDLEGQCQEQFPGSVDLIVGNLDYNISPREWKHILMTTFHPHVKILWITVTLQPDNTSLGIVKVGSIDEARFAISQFHRKKIGYKRIHVTLKNEEGPRATTNVRCEVAALLSDAKGNVLPLFKFIELFDKRYHRSISVSELYKMEDTIEIRKQGGAGRMVHLAQALQRTPTPDTGYDGEVEEILEESICQSHCPEGSTMYTQVDNFSSLPNVKLQLKTFSAQVHSLLMSHDGNIPLMSFPACYTAEFSSLIWVLEGGVPLEHLITCVPGIEIVVSATGVKKVSWAENKPPGSPELSRQYSSALLVQQLNQFSRDVIDLLKASPNCRLSYGNFIHGYQHHFGRQCRVADYGYTRLSELFDAIPHVLQVLGTGDRKVLTLAHRAQVRRFSADLLRLLKSCPSKQLSLTSLAQEFSKLFNRNWDVVEYGVCCIEDLLSEMPPSTVTLTTEGYDTIISIPRKDQTTEETERTKQFCLEVVDLLKHNHECRMLFNKFIPAYHHHFGRQCRVSDYGFAKLLDLFESIPQIIQVVDEREEKIIRLTEPELRKVVGEQIVNLLKQKNAECFPLDKLAATFTMHYGFAIPLQDFVVTSVEELVTKKLKHVLKLEEYDNKPYIVLADRTSAPPLARQVLQLLMDQSGGSLPLMELCSRYKTTFGIDPDIRKIKEELLDYVQVSGDEDSAVISLAPLQVLARDIRAMLQVQGKVSLALFEHMFKEKMGSEIKPALYGFPTTVALLLAIPHVVGIKGKGYRKMVHLSGDLQGSLPIIDESYTRTDSDTPSNDSGSALTDDELPATETRKFSPFDLLSGSVPASIPSPNILPDLFGGQVDLINLATPPPNAVLDQIFAGITDDEKRRQMSPLCHTPTSELLHLAAQCLPSNLQPSKGDCPDSSKPTVSGDPSQDIMDLLQHGWWRTSPAQMDDANKAAQSNAILNLINNKAPSHAGVTENTAITQSETSGLSTHQSDQGKSCNGQAFNLFSDKLNLKDVCQSVKSQEVKQNSKVDVTDTEPKTPLYSQVVAGMCKQTPNTTGNTKVPPNTPVNKVWNTESSRNDPRSAEESNKYLKCIQSVSATLSMLRKDHETKKDIWNKPEPKEIKSETYKRIETNLDEADQAEMENYIATCPRPLQPGSYWYAKIFENSSNSSAKDLPSSSSQDVRNIIDSLSNKKPVSQYKIEPKVNSVKPDFSLPTKSESSHKVDESSSTLTESIDTCESFSRETITDIHKISSDQGMSRSSSCLNLVGINVNDKAGINVNGKAESILNDLPSESVGDAETCATEINEEHNTSGEDKQAECIPRNLLESIGSEDEIESHKMDEPVKFYIGAEDSAHSTEQIEKIVESDGISSQPVLKPKEGIHINVDLKTETSNIPALNEPIHVCSDLNSEDPTTHNCAADDCLCYDSVFRQDHPLETSSLKSDTSFSTESPQVSPKKPGNRRHPSTSSMSDGSQNGSVNHPPRRSRIAAKFAQPLD